MIISPVIPIWAIIVICIGLLALKRKGIFPYIRQIIMVLLLACLLLRPLLPGEGVTEKKGKVNLKVLFVVDTTLSMLAEDGEDGATRFSAVVEDCKHIVRELEGATYAVVSFDNQAYLRAPFTSNGDYVLDTIEELRPKYNPTATGTTMSRPISLMESTLQSARRSMDDLGDPGKVVVFFISDGEETNDQHTASYAGLSKYIDDGAVLGYGTEQGGIMHYTDYEGNVTEVLSTEGEIGVAKYGEESLMKAAQEMQLSYIHMTNSSDVDKVLKSILKDLEYMKTETSATELSVNALDGATDISFYIAIPLLLMFVAEGVLFIKKK
ncbi:MAG: VWA domain-containing protein [Lachnospiraceae bacterium]|nr:VWA domain-containing protein [Lachnospiraceae bacterium]